MTNILYKMNICYHKKMIEMMEKIEIKYMRKAFY